MIAEPTYLIQLVVWPGSVEGLDLPAIEETGSDHGITSRRIEKRQERSNQEFDHAVVRVDARENSQFLHEGFLLGNVYSWSLAWFTHTFFVAGLNHCEVFELLIP